MRRTIVFVLATIPLLALLPTACADEDCPVAAESCPGSCVEVRAIRYDPIEKCRTAKEVVIGCVKPEGTQNDDVACGARADGVVVFGSSTHVPNASYGSCTEAQRIAASSAVACAP